MYAKNLLADYVNLISGASATDQERQALGEALGQSLFGKGANAMQGFKNLRDMTVAKMKANDAGFLPEVVDQYGAQGGPTTSNYARAIEALNQKKFVPPPPPAVPKTLEEIQARKKKLLEKAGKGGAE